MSRFLLERDSSKVKVIVGSELTAPVVTELRELLSAILEDGGKELILDFSQTTSLDASGIRLLLSAHNSFFGGGKSLKCISVQRSLYVLLEKMRLNQRLGAQEG
jgi:anti-anti-sigma factor